MWLVATGLPLKSRVFGTATRLGEHIPGLEAELNQREHCELYGFSLRASACRVRFKAEQQPFAPEASLRISDQSSRKLVDLRAQKRELTTITQMAYWLGPGEQSANCKCGSIVTSKVSDDRLTKTIIIGVGDIPIAIEYQATFHLSVAHEKAGFEAVTVYMPPALKQIPRADKGFSGICRHRVFTALRPFSL